MSGKNLSLLVETIQKMTKRAEKRVEEELAGQLQKVPGKIGVLVRMAEASLDSPEGAVKEVIFPVASEKLLRKILQEIRTVGPAYLGTVRLVLKRSYGAHYRRMLPELLDALAFRCANPRHQPVMEALALLKVHLKIKGTAYPEGVTVPLAGVVRPAWMRHVAEVEGDPPRINRIAYEVCVLRALRERLRCREIWVVGSRRYRNPEEHLPQDFEAKRPGYYAEMGIPLEAKAFTGAIRSELAEALRLLDAGMPTNPKVKILPKKDGWISVTPFEALPDPENLGGLKREVGQRWPATSLLDVLKEADFRTGFTQAFRSPTPRGLFICRYLASEELRREVNEGLNVVESWNAANGFIFYGRGGELATNRREDQEMGLLCLHLLQSSLVYINTLMIQRVLAEESWSERMTPRDLGALSPLLTQHINPYGRFELDLDARLLLEA